jgi:hypothetical protein
MLSNFSIFSLGILLAASCFVVPKLLPLVDRWSRRMLVAALFGAVFGGLMVLGHHSTALAVVVLGLVFAVIAQVLAINYEMVHSPNDPKHRRCY